MKPVFVKTQNAKAFLDALKALEQRGASEACLVVVDGKPGLGKTSTTYWWACENQAVFLRAKAEWTPAWFLRELLFELRVTPEHSFERMYKQAVNALGNRTAAAERDQAPFAVLIDEVDHISRNSRLLETVRDLSDMLEIPFILVGMGKVRHNLTRFPQIASRVGQSVEFNISPLDDVQAMITAQCEVPVEPCMVAFLHRASGGFFREVKEGMASIERFGRRNGGKPVSVVSMAGQVLLMDRTTGKPIIVRQ